MKFRWMGGWGGEQNEGYVREPGHSLGGYSRDEFAG